MKFNIRVVECFAKILFVLFIYSLGFAPLFGQWEPDVRLTNNDSLSYTSENNAWCVAATGDTVHVVWYDERNGLRQIYYKRSTNGGTIWGTDVHLVNSSAWGSLPSVAVFGSNVHVVWDEQRDGNDEIYYKRSTNSGTSWGADIRLTSDSAYSCCPSAAVFSSYVHVVWVDYRDDNHEIYYKRSTDNGTTWGVDVNLSNEPNMSWYPSVAVSDSNVHVVWQDYRDNNYEIYYKRSTDSGASWGTDTRLTYSDPWWSWMPSVAVSGPYIHVVWWDSSAGNWEIYYKRSTDNGASWGVDTRLTNTPLCSKYPSVAVSETNVHVTWMDSLGANNYELYYKRSTDNGTSWEADIQLTNDPALSVYPSVAVAGSRVHVVWSDERDGNYEIYYKRNPTGNSVSEEEIGHTIRGLKLLCHPNLFRDVTHLKLQVPRAKNQIELKIYNAAGRLVKSFPLPTPPHSMADYSLLPTSIQWNGSDDTGRKLPQGVYFIRLKTENESATKKLIILK
jgi:hypothetical protein